MRDIYQERADREGITRKEAKLRCYGEAWGLPEEAEPREEGDDYRGADAD